MRIRLDFESQIENLHPPPLFEKFNVLYADMYDGCLTFQKPND